MSYLSPLPQCLEVPKSRYGLHRSLSSPDLCTPNVPLPHFPRHQYRGSDHAIISLASRSVYGLAREYTDIRRQLYPNAPRGEFSGSRYYYTGARGKTYLRPQTINRYYNLPVYPMQEWTDRVGTAMDRISFLYRSMRTYPACMTPSLGYMLTPTYVYPSSTKRIQAMI